MWVICDGHYVMVITSASQMSVGQKKVSNMRTLEKSQAMKMDKDKWTNEVTGRVEG